MGLSFDFIGDAFDGASNLVGGLLGGGLLGGITGGNQADAATEGALIQAQAQREAREQMERLNRPYLDLGNRAIEGFNPFLADPSGHSFLQNNPMFNAAVENQNQAIMTAAPAMGRSVDSGGIRNELFGKYLSMADQFVNSAYSRAFAPVQLGQNAANFQGMNAADSITSAADSMAAGKIGAANAQSQGMNNMLGLGMQAFGLLGMGGFLSDERTKENMVPIGKDENGLTIYEYQYKNPLFVGYSAQEVAEKDPEHARIGEDGFLRVSAKYKPQRVA